MINLIGVAGYAGSGKTTVAKHLVEKHGFQLLGFATPLYELGNIHNVPKDYWHSMVYGWTDKYLRPVEYMYRDRWNFVYNALDVMERVPVQEGKNRTLLQLLGTEVGRALDEDLWTKIFEAKVEELGPDARIVNDNLRFPNEMECLQRLDFWTIFIDVPIEIRAARYYDEYGVTMDVNQLAHSSEAYLEEIKFHVHEVYSNVGDKKDLIEFVDSVVKDQKVKL